MLNLKKCLIAILLGVTTTPVFAYTNQCETVFSNGLQSHDSGIIAMEWLATMEAGSSHELKASEVKLPKLNADISCETQACVATGESSTDLPSIDFKHTQSTQRKKIKWFRNENIGSKEFDRVSLGSFSTAHFTHSGNDFIANRLDLSTGSTAFLKPGDYWIKTLKLGWGAKIKASSPGQIRIFTQSTNSQLGSEIGEEQYSQQILLVGEQIKLGTLSKNHAFVYAHDYLRLESSVNLYGALAAKNIKIQAFSHVYYRPDELATLNFGWICDLDNDGIYDGFDEDADGDGFDNELEIEAGSSPFDANDVPSDIDGDGIPDIRDDDIDGDGYSNEEEIAAGTDPYDPNSYPLPDPPQIALTIDNNQTIETQEIEVTGIVTQGDLSIAKVYFFNLNSPQDIELINLNADGTFSKTLTLLEGQNQFSFVVEDADATQVNVPFTVTYIVPFQLLSISPPLDSVLTEPEIQVVAEVKAKTTPTMLINQTPVSGEKIAENTYRFMLDTNLKPGENIWPLEVVSEDKSIQETIHYQFRPVDLSDYPPPQLSLVSPNNNTRTAQEQLPLQLTVQSNVGGLSAKVNGSELNVQSGNQNEYFVSGAISLSEGDNQFTVQIRDALDQVSELVLVVKQDKTAPVITLNGDYLSPPEVNQLVSTRFTLSGTVTADDVAALRINGVQANLSARQDGVYNFEEIVALSANQENMVVISAEDDLGNESTIGYFFYATNNLSMEWVTPVFPAEWIIESGTERPLAIKLKEPSDNETFNVTLVGPTLSQEIPITRIDNLITGNFPALTEQGQYQVRVSATENSQLVTELVGQLNVLSQADLPIKVVKVFPASEARYLEPDTFLQVNFNRPIDVDKLEITANRTLHGLTYINLDAPGVDFLHAKGMQLQEVNLDREVVQGNLSVLPDDSSFVFYPSQDLGYTADIDWTIKYDGQVLSKQRFSTRALPTIVEGGVKDALGQTIEGVTVEIEELGLTTVTNSDGGYAFGYGLAADRNIEGGRYHMLVNGDFKFNKLGEIRIPVDIKTGRRNQLPLLTVPNISDQVQWRNVPRNADKVVLASGELKLDLEGGQLQFPGDHRAIHAQFVPGAGNVRPVYPGAAPLWFYQLQPFGIKPSKPIHVQITAPKLRGTLNYLGEQPGEKRYSFLLGYSAERNVIEPLTVVEIQDGILKTIEPVDLENIDYFGYTHTKYEYQEQFKQYINHEISFIELIAQVAAE